MSRRKVALALSAALLGSCGAAEQPRPTAHQRPEPTAAPSAPLTPPEFYLLSLRAGFLGRAPPTSTSSPAVEEWFLKSMLALAGEAFYQPVTTSGPVVLSDGYNFATVEDEALVWTPSLRCGFPVTGFRGTFLGHFPTPFMQGPQGWVRWTADAQRWRSVGPDRSQWPSQQPFVADWHDGELLLLWAPRRRIFLISEPGSGAADLVPRLSPGFYVLGNDLRPLPLEVGEDFLEVVVLDLAATNDGVLLATSKGVVAWEWGKPAADWFPLALATPARGGDRVAWVDVHEGRAPEVAYVRKDGTPGIVRREHGTWSRTPVPFHGRMTAWAHASDGGRFYAEATEDGARIWRRSPTGQAPTPAWAEFAELPGGPVTQLAVGESAELWALANVGDGRGDLWYIPAPGKPASVTFPAADFHPGQLLLADDVAWVKAMGPGLQLALFTSRRFHERGVKLERSEDGCGPP